MIMTVIFEKQVSLQASARHANWKSFQETMQANYMYMTYM